MTVAAPAEAPFDRTTRAYQQRWWILGVLCFSLLVIVVDNSILNVALPDIQKALHASTSELQWIVDSYTLVFAGLLLTAGTLGDKFGRRGALQLGMSVFGIGSIMSAFASSPTQLIVTRGIMGIGAAFIMPATLSIITNTFPPEERGRAIAFWAAVAGVATAIGPISGGLLLAHFYWGSVFLVNIPIVIFALVTGFFLIPTSKDPSNAKLDVVGAGLSIVGLGALVYAIIQAGLDGWTAPNILVGFAIAAVFIVAFAVWEFRVDHPMLDVNFFKNPRFTAASLGITLLFFAMFGWLFLMTQYFQLVMGYSPLRAGVALLPMAITMMIVAPSSARIVERFGTKRVIAIGLGLASVALASFAMVPSQNISYVGDVMWRIVIMAFGMGLVMAPATESIMGSLPRAKAGVGSAVNDTSRQVGGALGVAVVGTIMTSAYTSNVASSLTKAGASPAVVEQATSGLGNALTAAAKAPPALQSQIITDARDAFVTGMHHGVLVAALATFIGMIVVIRWLPARAANAEVFQAQDVEEAEAEAAAAAKLQPALAKEA